MCEASRNSCFTVFPVSDRARVARRVAYIIPVLHDLNIIHTDLKPENILLYHSSYKELTNTCPTALSPNNPKQHAVRRILNHTRIQVIDFGSAVFQNENHPLLASTRYYRAPEIILELGWSFPCDVWSIGCILVELFKGDLLFPTANDLEHLAMMENVCGERINPSLVQHAKQLAKRKGVPKVAK
jgi:dual-specificity kinase